MCCTCSRSNDAVTVNECCVSSLVEVVGGSDSEVLFVRWWWEKEMSRLKKLSTKLVESAMGWFYGNLFPMIQIHLWAHISPGGGWTRNFNGDPILWEPCSSNQQAALALSLPPCLQHANTSPGAQAALGRSRRLALLSHSPGSLPAAIEARLGGKGLSQARPWNRPPSGV